MAKWTYEDIVNLPHHVSDTHPRMSRHDRAGQFSPFAALTGHDAAVRETARLTDSRIETAEDRRYELDLKLQLLRPLLASRPEVTVTYFVPDSRKAGGAYRTVNGALRRLDTLKRIITLADGTEIPMDDVLDIDSNLFSGMFGD